MRSAQGFEAMDLPDGDLLGPLALHISGSTHDLWEPKGGAGVYMVASGPIDRFGG